MSNDKSSKAPPPIKSGAEGIQDRTSEESSTPPPVQPLPSQRPPRQNARVRTDCDPEPIVALQAMHYFTAALTNYKEQLTWLARLLFDNDLDKLRRGQLKRLQQIDSFIAAGLIWKECRRFSDEQLALANLSRSFANQMLTRSALGTALLVSDGHVRPEGLDNVAVAMTEEEERKLAKLRRAWRALESKYAQRAKRFVEAAIEFGLLERDEACSDWERDNCKPLRASDRLHELMLRIGIGLVLDIDKDDQGAKGPDAPGDDDPSENGS